MGELVEVHGGRVIRMVDGMFLGRDASCNVPLNDRRASRRHARIVHVAEDDRWEVLDLNSRNGTYVNDEAIEHRPLVDGDVLRVGRSEWTIRLRTAPAPRRKRTLIGEIETPEVAVSTSDRLRVSLSLEETEGSVPNPLLSGAMHHVVILQIAESLGRLRDPQELVEHAMAQLERVFRQARVCAILLDGGEGLEVAAAHTRKGEPGDVHLSETVVDLVRERARSVLCRDPLLDGDLAARKSIIHSGVTSLLASPLSVDGEFLGMIYVDTDRADKPFGEVDLQLFSALAPILAVAVHNTRLVEQAKQQAELRAQLSRYLSPDLARRVADGEMNLNPGGEEQHGTVFFSDLVGFTPLSERLKPLELVDLLNRYFGRMEEVLFAHEGTLDKYQGDAIMAFWGVLTECVDPEGMAVRAALRMQHALYVLNGELPEGHRLAMGIGLASGRFVGCHLGTSRKIEFTVIGDTVNLGARIEGKSGRNRVMVDPATREALADRVVGVEFAPVALKGKSAPVPLVSVRGLLNLDHSVDLCVPVSIGKVADCLAVQGRLASSGEAVIDVLHTAPIEGELVTLRTAVPELAISPLRAQKSVTMAESAQVRRTRLIARAAAGWRELLTPGTTLPAACAIEALPRG